MSVTQHTTIHHQVTGMGSHTRATKTTLTNWRSLGWCRFHRQVFNYFSNHFIHEWKSALGQNLTHIPVRTSHAKCRLFKYWWSFLFSKVWKKIQVRSWWRSYRHRGVYVCKWENNGEGESPFMCTVFSIGTVHPAQFWVWFMQFVDGLKVGRHIFD